MKRKAVVGVAIAVPVGELLASGAGLAAGLVVEAAGFAVAGLVAGKPVVVEGCWHLRFD